MVKNMIYMKKTIIIIILIFLSVSVSALDLSVGSGGLAGYTFTRYTLEGGSVKSIQNMDRMNYAGFMFFNAAYGTLSVMYQGGNNTFRENMVLEGSELADKTGSGAESSLGFALLGKYPFDINERVSVFPMFGVEYHIALVQRRTTEGGVVYDRSGGHFMEDRDKDNNAYPLSAWNSLWVNIGGGLDYSITGPIFLRTELLFGFRLPTAYEMGALKVVEHQIGVKDPKLGGLTGSPALKIGVGYRL